MSGADENAKTSRGEVLSRAGLPMPFPDVDHPLVDVAASLGWCMSGGMGPAPLTAGEVMAWCEGMGESLTPWEFDMVRRMSLAFVVGSQAARAPYQPMIVRMGLATAAVSA